MKGLMQKLLISIVEIISLPFVFLAKIVGFLHASIMVGNIPTPLGCMVRYSFYRRTLNFIGDSVWFYHGCNFTCPNIKIGNNVLVGFGTIVGFVDIGNDTLIGPYCCLLSGRYSHGLDRTDIPIRLQPGKRHKIKIGNDCWLGANSTIMADIGEGSVIGAGAVVTTPIPAWSIAVGNPAKVIRSRKPEEEFASA